MRWLLPPAALAAYGISPLKVVPTDPHRFDKFILESLPQQVTVVEPRNGMGVQVLAAPGVFEGKVLRVATVLAQYLDNDGDGEADNDDVVAAMERRGSTMIMYDTADAFEDALQDWNSDTVDMATAQDVEAEEVATARTVAAGQLVWTKCRQDPEKICDHAMEEVFHLVHGTGLAPTFPDVWGLPSETLVPAVVQAVAGEQYPGQSVGRSLKAAMGLEAQSVLTSAIETLVGNCSYGKGRRQLMPPACVGHFFYEDDTCRWPCQVMEGLYHVVSTLNGEKSLEGCPHNSTEWNLCSLDPAEARAMVKAAVPKLYDAALNPKYALPLKMPDGSEEQAGARVPLSVKVPSAPAAAPPSVAATAATAAKVAAAAAGKVLEAFAPRRITSFRFGRGDAFHGLRFGAKRIVPEPGLKAETRLLAEPASFLQTAGSGAQDVWRKQMQAQPGSWAELDAQVQREQAQAAEALREFPKELRVVVDSAGRAH